jgi:hypothetical protein
MERHRMLAGVVAKSKLIRYALLKADRTNLRLCEGCFRCSRYSFEDCSLVPIANPQFDKGIPVLFAKIILVHNINHFFDNLLLAVVRSQTTNG